MFFSNRYSTSNLIPSQLSSIVSQSAFGAVLPSQAFDLAPVEPLSVDPQKGPILVEITNASTIVENVSFILDARRSIFLQLLDLLSFFILHLTSYHARYFLRKHPCKSRTLTADLMILPALRVILFLSTLRLSIPQFGVQLMVSKLYVQFIFSTKT